jgi:hypothetical protein
MHPYLRWKKMSFVSGIRIPEFARRDGCSAPLVRRAVIRGILPQNADGTIDPALVGTGWREGNRNPGKAANHRARSAAGRVPNGRPGTAEAAATDALDGEANLAAAEALMRDNGLLSIRDAERLKENYVARLRQLEYDCKSGTVSPNADILAAVAAEYAAVRSALLAIPAEQAPRIHRCRTVAEVQDLLAGLITATLEHLTRDAGA